MAKQPYQASQETVSNRLRKARERQQMLKFTNSGRSYDPVLRRINFTGFDGELEIPFTVDVDVLTSLSAEKYGDKAAYLIAFDADRSSINDVAREVYYNSSKKIYLLTPVDFQ